MTLNNTALAVCAWGCAAVLIVAVAPQAHAEEEPADADPPTVMNNQRLGKLLAQRFGGIEGREGFWIIRIAAERDEAAPEENGKPDERDPFDDTDEPKGEGEAEEVVLMVITDERANRMRIMTPIQKFDPKKEADAKLAALLLAANFDRALDAKYATSGDILWSCFVHPLSTLSEQDLDSALSQVQTLRKNTGTTYSSTDLIFGGGEEPPDEDELPPEL